MLSLTESSLQWISTQFYQNSVMSSQNIIGLWFSKNQNLNLSSQILQWLHLGNHPTWEKFSAEPASIQSEEVKNFQEAHIGLPQGGKNAEKVPQPAAPLPYPPLHKSKEISLDTHTRLQILLIVKPGIVCIIGNVLNLTARTSPGVNMWV